MVKHPQQILNGVWRFDEIWEAEKYVKIAELYLEDDDPVAADTFCSRAAMVMHEAHQKCVEPKGGNGEVSRFFNFLIRCERNILLDLVSL